MTRIMKWIGITFAAVLLLGIGAAIGQSEQEATPTPATETVQAASTPRAPAEPSVESDLDCDYVLGDFGESGDPAKGSRFIAGGTVSNAGTAPARVRVTFRWQQLGTSPVTARKAYTLAAGEERDVKVTVPATQDQVSLHQAAKAKCSAVLAG